MPERRVGGARRARRRARAALIGVVFVALAACGGGSKSAGIIPPTTQADSASSSTSPSSVLSTVSAVSVVTAGGLTAATTTAAVTEPTTADATEPTTAPTEATTATTAPAKVTVVIIGTVNGGQAGGTGVGSTDSASEMVREEDGTCQGWNGRRDSGLWTQDVKEGTPIVIVDGKSGADLGKGTLAAGKAENVARGSDEQWQCTFAFNVASVTKANSYAIKVGRHGPWPLQVDPTQAGAFAASVSTIASSQGIDACDPTQPLPTEVGTWRAVGQYWNNGIDSVCSAGLRVPAKDGVGRPCRPAGIASDRVVSVVNKVNPKLVYEDASGLKVDPKTLKPGTEVVVNVATGIACKS